MKNPSAKNYLLIFFLFVQLLLLFCIKSNAQPAGVPFLSFSPSPAITGMGSAASSIPIDDPFNFYYNPAQLGLSSRNFSAGFYLTPVQMLWVPVKGDFTSYALQGSYDLKSIIGIPIAAGIGFMHQKIDLGTFTRTNDQGQTVGQFSSYESANAFTLGFTFKYLTDISFGLTVKDINSIISPVSTVTNAEKEEGDAFATDIGILIDFPILETLEITENIDYHLNASIGYSLSNLGGDIVYTNRKSLLPRTERIGYGISMGLNFKTNNRNIDIIKLDWTSEAKDLLVTYNIGDYKSEYQGVLSEINIIDHVFLMDKSQAVTNQHGLRLSLAETLELYYGSTDFTSYGFSAGLNGIFKLISDPSDKNVSSYIADHIDVKFTFSSVSIDFFGVEYDYDRIYRGINISVFGF